MSISDKLLKSREEAIMTCGKEGCTRILNSYNTTGECLCHSEDPKERGEAFSTDLTSGNTQKSVSFIFKMEREAGIYI